MVLGQLQFCRLADSVEIILPWRVMHSAGIEGFELAEARRAGQPGR